MIIGATAANVQAQIARAALGGVDTIALTGHFSAVAINGLKPPHRVTLDCSAATFVGSGTEILESSNWTIKGGDWSDSVYGVFNVQNSHDLTFDGLNVHDYAVGSATIGKGKGAAFGFKACTDILLTNCAASHSQGDAIDLAACQRVQVLGCRGFALDYIENHTDFLQMWNLAGLPLTDSIDVFDCAVVGRCQGVGMYSTSAAQPPGMNRVRVRRLSIASSLSWAVNLHHATNSEVTDCYAMTLVGETKGWIPPTCRLTDGEPGTDDSGRSGNLFARNTNGTAPIG